MSEWIVEILFSLSVLLLLGVLMFLTTRTPHYTARPIWTCHDCPMTESTVSSECWTHHTQTEHASE